MASTRRLAAILAADMVGYSRLMGSTKQARRRRCLSIAPLPIRSLHAKCAATAKRWLHNTQQPWRVSPCSLTRRHAGQCHSDRKLTRPRRARARIAFGAQAFDGDQP
jgi:hypothetical protein